MKALAAELPDVPRWVEVRSMLLSGEGRVIGSVSTSPLSFVVVDPVGTAGVVGRPASASVRAAAEVAHEILAVPEDAGWTAAALPEWRREAATLYVLGEHARLPGFTEEEARVVTAPELVAAPELPAGSARRADAGGEGGNSGGGLCGGATGVFLLSRVGDRAVVGYLDRHPRALSAPGSRGARGLVLRAAHGADRSPAGLGCGRLEPGIGQAGREARVRGE